MPRCPTCGSERTDIPPEPPVGTIVRDRDGALHRRYDEGWGWPYGGCYPMGKWIPIWERRGPLVFVTSDIERLPEEEDKTW